MDDLAAMLHPYTCKFPDNDHGPVGDCHRAAAAIAPRLTPTPDDVRETLRANLFDGDEGGTVTMPIAHLLDEIVGVLMESTYLAAPRLTPDREALRRIADLGTRDDWPMTAAEAIGIARAALPPNVASNGLDTLLYAVEEVTRTCSHPALRDAYEAMTKEIK